MKYIVAVAVSLVILVAFVFSAVVVGRKHSGYVVQAALWSIVFVVWSTITKNWDAIVARTSSSPADSKGPIFAGHVKYTIVAGVLLIAGVATFGLMHSPINAGTPQEKVPATSRERNLGRIPHVPSCLDWLSVDLNASLRVEMTEDSKYSMAFVGLEKEDTILIYVACSPDMTFVARQIMNMSVETDRKVIVMRAESLGWTSWLKVREEFQ